MPQPLQFKSIHAGNYKAFANGVELNLAPLTVIFGRNGSGKSAAVRLPLAVAAALQGGGGPGLPLSVGDLTFGSSLASFCYGGAAGEGYSLDIKLSASDGTETKLTAQVHKDPKTRHSLPGQWLKSWECVSGTGRRLHAAWASEEQRYVCDGEGPAEVAGFSGLLPLGRLGREAPIAAALTPAPLVVHIGASRDLKGEDFTPHQPELVFDVGMYGEQTRKLVGALYTSQRRAGIDLLRRWTSQHLEIDLEIQELGVGNVQGTVLQGRPVRRSTLLPLSELGTGMAHALPIIAQCAVIASAQEGETIPSLVVCEEPEAHLHPRVQASLADVFVETALNGRAQVLVETHSETFVLRLRRRVAEGTLKPHQLALYWVDDQSDVTTLRRLPIDEDGEVLDWPEGWFDAALDEVRAIYSAREGR